MSFLECGETTKNRACWLIVSQQSSIVVGDFSLSLKRCSAFFVVEIRSSFPGSAVAGFEGVAVGGKASVALSSQGANLKAVDAGIQYSHEKSIIASVFS